MNEKKGTYATRLSAGLDLLTKEGFTIEPQSTVFVNVGKVDLYNTDFCGNVVGLIMPKSGLSVKYNIVARLGVIDQDYEGDVIVALDNIGNEAHTFCKGDKVAQLVVTPFVHLGGYEIADNERKENGFGSTGR